MAASRSATVGPRARLPTNHAGLAPAATRARDALATGDPGRGRSDAEMWAAASSGGTTLSFPGALLLPALPLELSSKALMLPARGALRK